MALELVGFSRVPVGHESAVRRNRNGSSCCTRSTLSGIQETPGCVSW